MCRSPFAPHFQVNQRMAGELFEHVIEKSDPGVHIINPGAVEIHLDGDIGFLGRPRHFGNSRVTSGHVSAVFLHSSFAPADRVWAQRGA